MLTGNPFDTAFFGNGSRAVCFVAPTCANIGVSTSGRVARLDAPPMRPSASASSAARAFCASLQIPILRAPSVDAFLAARRAHPESPLLVTGALETWSLRDWGPERLRSLDVEVPLEMSRGGADYRDAFRDDLPGGKTHAHRELGARAFVAGHPSSLRGFVDTFLSPDAKEYDTVAYLAQHDLLSRVPELDEACGGLPLPLIGEDPDGGDGDPLGRGDDDETKTKTSAKMRVSRGEQKKKTIRRNAWLGPRGTVTPLHRDPYQNFLCQAWGTKRFLLYPNSDAAHMDVFPRDSLLRNTSRIDPERLDEEKYAEKHAPFAKAAAARGARVDVRAGEALFMPAGTWHHVRATTPSFSVSYWW